MNLRDLSIERFLNLIYWYSLQGLDYGEDGKANPRPDHDARFGVRDWRVPGTEIRIRRRGVPDDAPDWWQGDDEATQSFFDFVPDAQRKAMGVADDGAH